MTCRNSVLCAAALILSGCAARTVSHNSAWRLTETRLTPPGAATGAFTSTLRPGTHNCADSTTPISLKRQGRHLRINTSPDALTQQPAGWLSRWAFDLESQNCVAPGSGLALANEVANSVALEPNGAFRLLNVTDFRGAWVDLIPGVRLQVVSPILRDRSGDALGPAQINGLSVAVRSTDNLLGFETTTYELRPKPNAPGAAFTITSVERNIGGQPQPAERPSHDYLQFPADAGFFRLVYKAGPTDFTALLIAAPTPAQLDRYTQSPDSCSTIPQAWCIAIPLHTAINPVVPVTANGRQLLLRWGASVGEALRQGGWRETTLPPGIQITRPHKGQPAPIEFAPGDTTLMKLIVLGGETLTWPTPPPAPVSKPADNWAYPPTGAMVDLGGRRVHLNCTGSGSPTVMILGAGFSFDWGLVQPEVAGFTRVCTYDPAGTAWSDPGPGLDCQQRVDEVRRVLSANHERGPYILAGLSIGALTARLFAAEYPQEAAGLVLLDHAFLNPGSAPRSPLNQPVVDSPDNPPRLLEMVLPNITAEDDPGFANLPERLKALHYWATARHPPLPTVLNAQTCEAAVDAATEGKTTPLGKLPLVVISTENDTPGYAELQRHLLSLSTSSQQLIAKKSFHAIEMSEPAVAVAAIRAAVDAARAP